MTEGALPVNTFDIVWKRVPYNSSFITKGPGHHVRMCSGENNAIFTQSNVMLVLFLDRLK